MAETISNLQALVDSDAFKEVQTALPQLRAEYIDDETIYPHLQGLSVIMRNLAGAVPREAPTLPTVPPTDGE